MGFNNHSAALHFFFAFNKEFCNHFVKYTCRTTQFSFVVIIKIMIIISTAENLVCVGKRAQAQYFRNLAP